ncbi:MAG: dihydroorotase, partial [Endomicrobiia bacterium]
MKILIKNGLVVDPNQKLEKKLDLFVDNGKIVKLSSKINKQKNTKIIDAKGCVVCPGLIDIHTHLREPGHEEEETIATGTRAAASGGITTVFCMPNTHPVIDNQPAVEFILLKAKKEGVINVFPVGTITKNAQGEELSEIGELKKAGVVGISDDGEPVMNSKIMRRALEYSKMFNIPVISHCEDKNLSKDGVVNEGRISTLLGLRGIPKEAEEVMVMRDIILSSLTGGKLHITHISTKNTVEYIRWAKKQGISVTCDTAPHYFVLTEDYVKGKKLEHIYDTNAKMKPPLRTQEDLEAIIQGIKDGTIDCIASDHAPHTLEEKSKEFDLA